MSERTKAVLATLTVAAVTVVGMDAATYAGTGDSLILGNVNKSKQTTHVTSTGKGPALSLHAKQGRPALAVDSKAKVVRLNADKVDGRDAAALQNNVRVFTAPSGRSTSGSATFRLPNFPRGRYQATYSVYLAGANGTVANPTAAYCSLSNANGTVVAGYTEAMSSVAWDIGLSASDIINKNDTGWRLACTAYQAGVGYKDWSFGPEHFVPPVRVTLTRVNKTIGGQLTTIRSRPEIPLSRH